MVLRDNVDENKVNLTVPEKEKTVLNQEVSGQGKKSFAAMKIRRFRGNRKIKHIGDRGKKRKFRRGACQNRELREGSDESMCDVFTAKVPCVSRLIST